MSLLLCTVRTEAALIGSIGGAPLTTGIDTTNVAPKLDLLGGLGGALITLTTIELEVSCIDIYAALETDTSFQLGSVGDLTTWTWTLLPSQGGVVLPPSLLGLLGPNDANTLLGALSGLTGGISGTLGVTAKLALTASCTPHGGDCDPHNVPEPAALALLGIGLSAGGLAIRRRRGTRQTV